MIVTRLPEAAPRPRRIAVGTFDGVHLGHRAVIEGADTVLTFDPHPRSVIDPVGMPHLLTPLARKAELIAEIGARELVVIEFDRDFAAQSAQAFHDDVLVGRLGVTHVSVGENFRYGAKAQGDTELLAADGRFAARVVPLLEVDGEIVSSSHIRGLVAGGAIEYAGQLLGAPFSMTGTVAHGDARGRTLGFPTANLVPYPGFVTPAHGVYACRVQLPDDEEPVAAATNVGVRPQFSTGRGELVEAFLIDWTGDLYGREIRVDFLKRLRGEKRFASVDALVEQMHADVEQARVLASLPPRQ
ncbi:MAG: bifunctional riboflavin kinase/FAD synthetase [Solirubrobacterales bacterium]|nr:bifunctional riboflavin kinase/FAD synthetase [Solirubrobacterales bacterium]